MHAMETIEPGKNAWESAQRVLLSVIALVLGAAALHLFNLHRQAIDVNVSGTATPAASPAVSSARETQALAVQAALQQQVVELQAKLTESQEQLRAVGGELQASRVFIHQVQQELATRTRDFEQERGAWRKERQSLEKRVAALEHQTGPATTVAPIAVAPAPKPTAPRVTLAVAAPAPAPATPAPTVSVSASRRAETAPNDSRAASRTAHAIW